MRMEGRSTMERVDFRKAMSLREFVLAEFTPLASPDGRVQASIQVIRDFDDGRPIEIDFDVVDQEMTIAGMRVCVEQVAKAANIPAVCIHQLTGHEA